MNANSLDAQYSYCETCGELIRVDPATLGRMCEDCQLGRRANYRGHVYLLPAMRALVCTQCNHNTLRPLGGIGFACVGAECACSARATIRELINAHGVEAVRDFAGLSVRGDRGAGWPPVCQQCNAMRWKVGGDRVECMGCGALGEFGGYGPEHFAGRDNVWREGEPDPLKNLVVALNLHRARPGRLVGANVAGELIPVLMTFGDPKEAIRAEARPAPPIDPYLETRIVILSNQIYRCFSKDHKPGCRCETHVERFYASGDLGKPMYVVKDRRGGTLSPHASSAPNLLDCVYREMSRIEREARVRIENAEATIAHELARLESVGKARKL